MEDEQARQDKAGWQFTPEDEPAATQVAESPAEPVRWTASEYVAHHKSTGWFLLVALSTLGVAGLVYALTGGEILSTVMILIAGTTFGVFAARRPQVLEYVVAAHGISIGRRQYGWNEFKSFAVVDENALHTVELMPLKRFHPPISIYFAPDDEAAILAVLSASLPVERRSQDPLERLMHKVRF